MGQENPKFLRIYKDEEGITTLSVREHDILRGKPVDLILRGTLLAGMAGFSAVSCAKAEKQPDAVSSKPTPISTSISESTPRPTITPFPLGTSSDCPWFNEVAKKQATADQIKEFNACAQAETAATATAIAEALKPTPTATEVAITKAEREQAVAKIDEISTNIKNLGILELNPDSSIPAGKGSINVGILRDRVWGLLGGAEREFRGSNPPPAEGYLNALKKKIAEGDLNEAWKLRQGIEDEFLGVGASESRYIPTEDELENYPGMWGSLGQKAGSSEWTPRGILNIEGWKKAYLESLEVFYRLSIPWNPQSPFLPEK